MSQVSNILQDVEIPQFYHVAQKVRHDHCGDAAEALLHALTRPGTLDHIQPGMRVAITGSSRELANIVVMMRTLAGAIRERGAQPFVVPAMGSHGGATAEGQRRLLAGYGVFEENIGMPVLSSMETRIVGHTIDGLPVHVDANALDADCIIPFGRIKAHTDFRGDYESGIMKMMVIGLGKQHGAGICHSQGYGRFAHNIYEIGRTVLEKCKIAFGIGVIENPFHETFAIHAIPAEHILEEEPPLLRQAKSIMPKIPFEKVDILMVEESGKDISGNGMDSNVIGRSVYLGQSEPFINRIGVLRLSAKTGGSFAGIGHADLITRKLFEQGDMDETYPNCITCHLPMMAALPPVMETDRLCLQGCIYTCTDRGPQGQRIVWIHNTLSLESFYINAALLEEAQANPALTVDLTPYMPIFTQEGDFNSFQKITT